MSPTPMLDRQPSGPRKTAHRTPLPGRDRFAVEGLPAPERPARPASRSSVRGARSKVLLAPALSLLALAAGPATAGPPPDRRSIDWRFPSSGDELAARRAARQHGEARTTGKPSALEQALSRSRSGWGKALETFTVGSAADGDCEFNDLQSAIDAAAANGSTLDFILVARNQSYTGVALTVDSQDLAIFGGYDDCADRTPDGDTTLTGSSDSVFEISGPGGGVGVSYGVTLRDLVIQQGDAVADLAGGGLYVRDGVQVDLDSSTVRNNDAIFGGGIAVEDAVLVLLPGTLVHGNDAADGGGISCLRSSVEVRSQSSIYDNEATLNGGGIHADDCTVESGAGPVGVFTLGIVLNDAGSRGGGIYALSSDIELRGTATSTALLGGNRAAVSVGVSDGAGGGAYLDAGSHLDALNASIVENQALNATAAGGVLARGGSTLVMDRVSGVGCNPDGRCSELSRNSGSGAAALAALGATVTLRRTFVEDNVSTAPSVLRLTDSSTALLEGVVFATNEWEPLSSDAAGIEITGSASATVAYLTSWGNMQFDQTLFSAGSDTEPLGLTLLSSVIDDPFGSALLGAHDPDTSSVFLDCVMLRDDDDSVTPYATSTVLLDEPARLVSPETGDFHLGPDSPAIDFCDIFYYLPSGGDIDGEPRGTDIPEVPNGVGNGTYDLGADEVLPGSEIFADGFESGDTSAWSAMVGG